VKAAPTPPPSAQDLAEAWQTYVTPVSKPIAPTSPPPVTAVNKTSPVTIRSSSLSESQITALVLNILNRPDVQEKYRGDQGPQGPQGAPGTNGTTTFNGGTSSTNPIAYFPVGVTTQNS